MNCMHKLFVLGLGPVLALGAGCGGGADSLFYAELEEPAICKTVPDVPMDPTAPGATLTKTIPINLAENVPLFDTDSGNVVVRLLEVKFTGKQGIRDFNSVDTAEVLALPDPSNTELQPTQVLSYTRVPGADVNLELNILAQRDVDLVPFLTNGVVTVEARMTGGLPNNVWTADVRGCIYMKVRVNYLEAYDLPF
jgi:hypothetical protein